MSREESQAPPQIWLMLAFPGDDIGHFALRAFAPAKSGKCWYRQCRTREQAIACKRELLAAGIEFTCRKVDEHRPGFVGPMIGGKPDVKKKARRPEWCGHAHYPDESHLSSIDRRYLPAPRRFKLRRK